MTIAPSSTDADAVQFIGVCAHITAALHGGPRYRKELAPAERSSIQNAIFLCSNCAMLIDKNNEHDKELFLKAESILSADRLLEILSTLEYNQSILIDEIHLIGDLIKFYSKSAHEYVNKEIDNGRKWFFNALTYLSEFIQLNFDKWPYEQKKSNFQICLHPTTNYDRGGDFTKECSEKHELLTNEMVRKIRKTTKEYAQFRRAVKELLYFKLKHRPMIDFSELPEDGIKFEQLIRELLVREGFETHWTGVGQDGGRDLVVTEKLKGNLSEYNRKWLISCKHKANSGKSLGRDEAGNISEDCKAIGAEGYILVCSTQPSASLVTRLAEIEQNQKIITRFWDCIEIEKRLLNPNAFGLIHTFFPKSSENYKWKIYNAFSPAFWAANYKDYFFYMSCRHSNTYPYLENIETIVSILEQVPIHKDKESWGHSHYLRLRAVYYDDKHCTHTVYVDYIAPKDAKEKTILNPKELQRFLSKAFMETGSIRMNEPGWDVRYLKESTGSDSFELDHKRYYEPYTRQFEQGSAREDFLHDQVYISELLENERVKMWDSEKVKENFLEVMNSLQKQYTKSEKEEEHKKAYEPWSAEDDERLELLFCEGKTVKELMAAFERNEGAIKLRIKKLELREKYDR